MEKFYLNLYFKFHDFFFFFEITKILSLVFFFLSEHKQAQLSFSLNS